MTNKLVKYTDLIPGKKYKLGDIKVGKFLRIEGESLIFLDSEFGEKGENEIYKDIDDDFELINNSKINSKSKSRRKSIKRSRKSRKNSR
jgi:hypothetical protein